MGKLSTPISLIILGFVWLVILVNFVNFGVWMFSERGLPLFPEIFGSFVILFSVYIGICWYNLFMGKSWARTSLITITLLVAFWFLFLAIVTYFAISTSSQDNIGSWPFKVVFEYLFVGVFSIITAMYIFLKKSIIKEVKTK